MTLHHRTWIAVTGLLAAVTLGVTPTPAYAAGTDLGVELAGTTLAAGVTTKLAKVILTNHGTTRPDTAELMLDLTGLDTTKVSAEHPACEFTGGAPRCKLPRFAIPAPGDSTEHLIMLNKLPGASGAAGALSITIAVDGDSNRANDTATADVAIVGQGPDFLVLATDVSVPRRSDDPFALPTGEPVAPGSVGLLAVVVLNQGDMTAAGVKVHVRLPKQTTFADDVDGCEQSPDHRSLTCVLDDVKVTPLLADELSMNAYLVSRFPVRVAPDAKGPVSLHGGQATVVALDRQQASPRRAETSGALPEAFSRPTAEQIAALDADPTDNTGEFAVLVAGPTDGNGGGSSDGAGAGDGQTGQGSGDGLPVTGPAALTLGGVGVVVAALGVLLLVLSRRRSTLVQPRNDR